MHKCPHPSQNRHLIQCTEINSQVARPIKQPVARLLVLFEYPTMHREKAGVHRGKVAITVGLPERMCTALQRWVLCAAHTFWICSKSAVGLRCPTPLAMTAKSHRMDGSDRARDDPLLTTCKPILFGLDISGERLDASCFRYPLPSHMSLSPLCRSRAALPTSRNRSLHEDSSKNLSLSVETSSTVSFEASELPYT